MSGFFVWLREDFEQLKKLVINPGRLPYESVERAKADVQQPLTSIELSPLPDYPFPSGITGLLGTLLEERPPRPRQGPKHVREAHASAGRVRGRIRTPRLWDV